MSSPYRVFGVQNSPFSVKVRSYFRYKGLAHEWIVRNGDTMSEYQKYAKLPIVPLVVSRSPGRIGRWKKESWDACTPRISSSCGAPSCSRTCGLLTTGHSSETQYGGGATSSSPRSSKTDELVSPMPAA